MNQERAILHFNKFKAFKNEYLKDTLKGVVYKIVKVKLVKNDDSDYTVILFAKSDINNEMYEIDSIYAHANFKPVS